MSRKETKKQRQAIFGFSEIIRQEDEIESLRKKLAETIAEAQKDSARLDYMLDHLKENTDLHNMTGHPDDNGVFLTYWGTGLAYTTRGDIDAAMNISRFKTGGLYNWKNQPERLVYLGYNRRC